MSQNKTLFAEIEKLIRDGDSARARLCLSHLRKNKLNSNERYQAARFARRLDDPKLGLLLLRPIVELSQRQKVACAPDIQIEYAVCLIKQGISSQGVRLLQTVDPERHPHVLLYRSFAHFSNWEYAAAVPLMERYIKSPQLTDYERIIGTVNWIAALVGARNMDEADRQIRILVPKLQERNLSLLLGNTYELWTQVAIFRRQIEPAAKMLDLAARTLSLSQSRYRFFIEKWKIYLSGLQNGPSSDLLTRFQELSHGAAAIGDFETIRECDLLQGEIFKDLELIRKVYFGTPYSGYRNRIKALQIVNFDETDTHLWQFKQGSQTEVKTLDLYAMKWGEDSLPTKRLKNTERLLQLLTTDFYRPFAWTRIYNNLFPEEIFDPVLDPHRIYELIRRANGWLKESGLPFDVSNDPFGYRISASQTCAILLKSDLGDRASSFEDLVRRSAGGASFKAREAQQWSQLPLTTVIRRLNSAVVSGRCEKKGKGKNTVYAWRDNADVSKIS